jgi:hypothetical protein
MFMPKTQSNITGYTSKLKGLDEQEGGKRWRSG